MEILNGLFIVRPCVSRTEHLFGVDIIDHLLTFSTDMSPFEERGLIGP